MTERHSRLNPVVAAVDVSRWMSSEHNRPKTGRAQPAGPAEAEPDATSAARLAHELANLLDAGMRNVGLAMSSLRDTRPQSAGEPETDVAEANDPVTRLEAVSVAMNRMACLLQRWVDQGASPQLFCDEQVALGDAVRHAVRLLGPAAEAEGIDVQVTIDAAAGLLPAGPVYAVIANGLRNSIEALLGTAAGGLGNRQPGIELQVALIGTEVVVRISDNGPGLPAAMADASGRFRFGTTTKPAGRGIGLVVAREASIVLGGALEIRNRATGGTELVLRYPANIQA